MSIVIEKIRKTREYLDYIEEHYNNVQKAWRMVQKTCKNMDFMNDDLILLTIDYDIRLHDLSKLGHNEFISYREEYFAVDDEIKTGNIKKAWKHHKKVNKHHFENWTKYPSCHPHAKIVYCVHMVVDWIAMSLKFKKNARHYYNDNIDETKLPDWAILFINEIFDAVYGKVEEEILKKE